jgi:CRP-like cAMP-binding protein
MNYSAPLSTREVRLENVSFVKGATVFAQGERGDAAYILERGSIRIFQHVESHIIELDTLKPGEIFGEMAVMDRGIRMASAVTCEDSVVTRVPIAIFEQKLDNTDKFIRGLITMFMKNIRGAHRIFIRRPRSFRDHVKQMRGFGANMRRFSTRIADEAVAEELTATLLKLDHVLDELAAVGQRSGDKRHDLILEDDEVGVGLRALVGSEIRRPR